MRGIRRTATAASLPVALCLSLLGPGPALATDPTIQHSNASVAGLLVVADHGGTSAGSILVVDPVTGATKVGFSESWFHPHAIAPSHDGLVYVAIDHPSMSLSGYWTEPWFGRIDIPGPGGRGAGVAFAPDGDPFHSTPDGAGGGGAVSRMDSDLGRTYSPHTGGAFVDPSGLAATASGDLYVADPNTSGGNGAVIFLDTETGGQRIVSSGGAFRDPMGVALLPDGNLVVADRTAYGGNGGLIKVDPRTAVQTRLSSGGSFVDPTGVTVAANGDIFVADPAAFGGGGGIIGVDLETGLQRTVASGSAFRDPVGVAVVDTLRYHVPTTGTEHDLVLRRTGDRLRLTDEGLVKANGVAAYIRRAIVVGRDASDDTLSVDHTGGAFLLPGGISFSGGTGSNGISARADSDMVLTANTLSGPRLGLIRHSGIAHATLTGGPGANHLDASDFAGTKRLEGGGGPDLLVVESGPATLLGGAGDDELWGKGSSTVLVGGPGDDTMDGGGKATLEETGDVDLQLGAGELVGRGSDTFTNVGAVRFVGGGGASTFTLSDITPGHLVLVDGGGGHDRFVVEAGESYTLKPTRQARDDWLEMARFDEVEMRGGAGDDTLDATAFTAGPATLLGRGGSDVLRAGARDDLLLGGAGNDLLSPGLGDDEVSGGVGIDRVVATRDGNLTLTDTMLTGIGTDILSSIERATLTGGAGANTLDASGTTRPVVLSGAAGADTLKGGSAGDSITGGPGGDTLLGNAGNDILNAADGVKDSLDGGPGTDSGSWDTTDVRSNIP